MSTFTLPEVKLFKQRMVNNMIQDLNQDLQEEKRKWDDCFKIFIEFDNDMTLENYQEVSKCKGQKSLHYWGDKIKFILMAKGYLLSQLQLYNIDDLAVKEKADLHCQIWKYNKEMMIIDAGRTSDLKIRLRNITKFKKLDDNVYEVIMLYSIKTIA